MSAFNIDVEDRALNQYWYSPATIEALVKEIQLHGSRVAFLSTPSLYFSLTDASVKDNAVLFEYDDKFAAMIETAFKEADTDNNKKKTRFVHYDYNKPESIPIHLYQDFDYVVVDPPFITPEVWGQYAITVKALLKKDSGKVLFTSVLENHNMLETAHDMPLFVASFMPSIPHLVYQYFVFVNYAPASAFLSTRNPEVPYGVASEQERKMLQAIQMANDLRESEIAFTLQMQTRDRANEVPLPAPKKRLYVGADGSMLDTVESCASGAGGCGVGESSGVNPLLDRPIEEMRWSYVPKGLTEYANGAAAPPSADAEIAAIEDFGPAYEGAKQRRLLLDEFKRGVDTMQKHLDVLLKAAAAKPPADTTATEAERKALSKRMGEIKNEVAALGEDAMLIEVLSACIEAYRTVALTKAAAQELAADATRKFKSPIFNRQKVLLQDMKKFKQEHLAAMAPTAAA